MRKTPLIKTCTWNRKVEEGCDKESYYKYIINSVTWNIGRSETQWHEQNRQYYHRESFYNWKAFHWDSDKRNEACSYGWQRRMSLNVEKNYSKVFFGKFGLSGLWCNEHNQRLSTSILLYMCNFLNWVYDEVIRTCSGWGIQVSKWSEMKKVAVLGKFALSRH